MANKKRIEKKRERIKREKNKRERERKKRENKEREREIHIQIHRDRVKDSDNDSVGGSFACAAAGSSYAREEVSSI